MSSKLRILLPVHTVADWGGLQDWTVGMVRGLVAHGAEVSLISNNVRVVQECGKFTKSVLLIDWEVWQESVDYILDTMNFDVIFSQPFRSRELALELRSRTDVPLVYMFHGNNSDFCYLWKEEVAKFLVASSSLIPMVRQFCGAVDVPVEVLPNGVPRSLFEKPTRTFDERRSTEEFSFVMAARLMPDKISQAVGLVQVVSTLLDEGIIPSAQLHVMGGGPSRPEFESRLGQLAKNWNSVQVKFHGWVSQETVLDRLRSAVFSVAGGVTGAQSVALGTPCLGAGIRGIYGVSTPDNMERVLGSNFGDHSAMFNFSAEEILADSRWILEEHNFARFQEFYVPMMREERTHEAIAELAYRQISAAI